MEGGSIETRVIIDPPNGSRTNADGKVILIPGRCKLSLSQKILSIHDHLLTPGMPGNISRPIPDTWSPWLSLWDVQRSQQRA